MKSLVGVLAAAFVSVSAQAQPVCVDPNQNVLAKAIVANPDSSISIVQPAFSIAGSPYFIVDEDGARQGVCLLFGKTAALSVSTISVPPNSDFVFLDQGGALKHVATDSNYRGGVLTFVRCN